MRSKKLRIESLENREMLAVTAGAVSPIPETADGVSWIVNTNADPETWSTTDSILSLREALARASSGDTILFDPSMAHSTISLTKEPLTVNKAVTINATSMGGITVSGAGICSVFYIDGNSCSGSVTMISVTITSGYTTGFGGAIENSEGKLFLKNCVLHDNTANFGGAVFNHFGTLTVTDTEIYTNHSNLYGAGIFNHYGTLSISNSTIWGNYGYNGGGIYNENGTVSADNTRITVNTADYNGGGIQSFYGTINLTNCYVNENTSREGGGIFLNTAEANFTNCAIVDNYADNYGGGIHNFWGTTSLRNCTIAGNAASYAGGIYASRSSSTTLYNSICAFNENDYAGSSDIYGEEEASLFNYWSLTTYSGWTSSANPIRYNASKPLFNNTMILDYSLAANSQAINIGNNGYVSTSTDIDGNSRINDLIVDLGAYESESVPLDPLKAPSILNGSSDDYLISAGKNRHQLSWTMVNGAEAYEINYSEDGKIWKSLISSKTTATISGLTYGKTVQYKVRALGDGISYDDSDWSKTKSFCVCPADIDEDGFIGPGDSSILSYSWFSTSSDEQWNAAADIDGDGFVGPGDRSYLSANWFCVVGDDDIIYPVSAADAVFAELFEDFV